MQETTNTPNTEYALYEITYRAVTTQEAGLTAPMSDVYEALEELKALRPLEVA